MPQLTNQQLLLIETTLIEKYNFKNFDDVRLEIQDHIASEIEAEMENDFTSFEMAFANIMQRWNKTLIPKSWRTHNEVPYLIQQFLSKLELKFYAITFPITILLAVFFLILQSYFISNLFFYMVSIFALLSGAYVWQMAKNIQFKTTLSFYATDRLSIAFFAMLVMFGLELVLHKFYDSYTFIPNIIMLQFVFQFLHRAIMMKKNMKIENQLLKLV